MVMQKNNISADYNVICFLTKNGELTPRSSLVVTSFSMHASFNRVFDEANNRVQPLVLALEKCNSVPWKCVVTIISRGAIVAHSHRRYLINYVSDDELPF